MKKKKENRFYVYVYLDPRKPGNYEYLDQGLGISFDHEPFYIGKGQEYRWNAHLRESRKLTNKFYKHLKIRNIWEAGLKPIIYKIFTGMLEQPAYNLEETLGFLIGRHNLDLGPLANETDCGSIPQNRTEESKKKSAQKSKDTLKNNPLIKENSIIELKKTLENNPEIRINATIKRNKTIEDPSIREKWGNSFKETVKNDPTIISNRVITYKKTIKENPSIGINKGIKISKTKIEEKTSVGAAHPRYVNYDYSFIIITYFTNCNIKQLIDQYNETHSIKLNYRKYNIILNTLNFPSNSFTKFKEIKEIVYVNFIEDNKDKIQWFIDNFKILEEQYYNKKWEDKYKI